MKSNFLWIFCFWITVVSGSVILEDFVEPNEKTLESLRNLSSTDLALFGTVPDGEGSTEQWKDLYQNALKNILKNLEETPKNITFYASYAFSPENGPEDEKSFRSELEIIKLWFEAISSAIGQNDLSIDGNIELDADLGFKKDMDIETPLEKVFGKRVKSKDLKIGSHDKFELSERKTKDKPPRHYHIIRFPILGSSLFGSIRLQLCEVFSLIQPAGRVPSAPFICGAEEKAADGISIMGRFQLNIKNESFETANVEPTAFHYLYERTVYVTASPVGTQRSPQIYESAAKNLRQRFPDTEMVEIHVDYAYNPENGTDNEMKNEILHLRQWAFMIIDAFRWMEYSVVNPMEVEVVFGNNDSENLGKILKNLKTTGEGMEINEKEMSAIYRVDNHLSVELRLRQCQPKAEIPIGRLESPEELCEKNPKAQRKPKTTTKSPQSQTKTTKKPRRAQKTSTAQMEEKITKTTETEKMTTFSPKTTE